MRQTTILKHKEVQKEWFIVDAEGQTLGRLSTLVASVLRGKHKPTFTPNVDCGDNIVIINAEKIVLTSDKEEKKMYYTHSGYPGGLTERTAAEQRAHKPTSLVEKSIAGMLPHTPLGRTQFRNLYVYEGADHKHEAQQPKKLEVK